MLFFSLFHFKKNAPSISTRNFQNEYHRTRRKSNTFKFTYFCKYVNELQMDERKTSKPCGIGATRRKPVSGKGGEDRSLDPSVSLLDSKMYKSENFLLIFKKLILSY
jgi:hypothetical protein